MAFDTITATAAAQRKREPTPYQQAVAMQRILMAQCQNPETPAGYAAQCARAWDVLEERKRVMKMQPAPRPIDTTKTAVPAKSNRTKPAPSFDES